MSVINYLSLNSIYVIIASIFIILFIILNIFLFINFELELSKSLNDNCENPIAIYFDKSNRERCLTEKITKKNETSVNEAEHEIKKTTLKTNIDKINTQIKDSYNYLNNILTMPSPEIQKISKEIPNLDDLNSYINSTFENTSSAIKKINADFENTINTNIVVNQQPCECPDGIPKMSCGRPFLNINLELLLIAVLYVFSSILGLGSFIIAFKMKLIKRENIVPII